MTIQGQIRAYIAAQPEPKRNDMNELHLRFVRAIPKCRLWFLDGKDDGGRVVSNPSIGYGFQVMQQSGGKTREFYQVGMSANTTGISVYILGMKDKKVLVQNYSKKLGKASVTGYCIKFRALTDIDVEVLEEAVRYGVSQTSN